MSLKLKNITKQYRLGRTIVKAVNNVSFSIEQGDFLSIVGPSGSGKSTILHILGALDKPDRGDVIIDGISTANMNDTQLARIRREKIGFIFQSFNLISVLSVFANVEFPLKLMKVGKTERQERVMKVLESVNLADRALHKTEELSGGQRQRVAIARALVINPKILLSDEPTANLDSNTGKEIIDLMKKLNEEKKVTLVFATHDLSIVSRVRRVINILDGQVTKDEVIR